MKHFIYVLTLIVVACSQPNVEQEFTKFTEEDETSFKEKLDKFRAEILDTRDLTIQLREEDYTYRPDLIHDISIADDYFNSKEQALNIGVYATDLNYMTIFEQDARSLQYAETIFELAEKLSISEAFDREYLFELLSNNVPGYRIKSDELNDLFEHAKNEINSADRAQISALIVAGGWVEGMYISTALASENWPNEALADQMWEQCFSYHQVLKMLRVFKDYPPCNEVYRKFKELEPAVSNITETSVRTLHEHLDSYHGVIMDLREYVIKN